MITLETVSPATQNRLDRWWLLAVGAVILSVLAASIWAPDMITGSDQEHLPIVAFTDWLWGAVALGFVAFVRKGRADLTFALSVAMLWVAVALASIFAPELVTGTDPTRIPIAALVAPIAGAVGTGFLALNAATSR